MGLWLMRHSGVTLFSAAVLILVLADRLESWPLALVGFLVLAVWAGWLKYDVDAETVAEGIRRSRRDS